MSLFAIIIVLILGIFLLLLEFLIIPGFTVFGIGGFIFLVVGIGSAYYFHDSLTGNITLICTAVVSLGCIYFFIFKKKTWQNMGLKANIESKNAPFEQDKIHPGDTGVTITRLAPIGKAVVNDIICEAKSVSGYINQKTDIEVIKVLNTQIIVKPKN